MILETERLILRPWQESDAKNLFKYAKDPLVGPRAGRPAHTSEAESLEIAKNVLMKENTFAICLKEDNQAIGAISLKSEEDSDLVQSDQERELGYWLGVPFWSKGYIPEAAREVLRYGFEELGLQRIWCGYYDGNSQSRRVQEKMGFQYQRTQTNSPVPLLHETRICHISLLKAEDWKKQHPDKQS